jgi:AhpD family alkylhydroperoxidase
VADTCGTGLISDDRENKILPPLVEHEREEPAMADLMHYEDACSEVRAVYDDIKRTRGVTDVNNFWKALAAHPPTLKRTWASVKEVMGPGVLDTLTKEMLYLAVSATNGCGYCIASHGAAARKAGMTQEMWGELLAIIGMANETNKLAFALQVPIDPMFLDTAPKP